MHRFDLKGKVALVTGGNGGIGQGIARGLLECGAQVVIAGRNDAKNKAAVAELSKIGSPVSAFVLDVTDDEQSRAAVQEVVRRYGKLNILVNNAGIGSPDVPVTPDYQELRGGVGEGQHPGQRDLAGLDRYRPDQARAGEHGI